MEYDPTVSGYTGYKGLEKSIRGLTGEINNVEIAVAVAGEITPLTKSQLSVDIDLFRIAQ